MDAAAVAASAAAYTNGTLSAWIMIPDNTGSYAIIGFGDASVNEFITFSVVAGKLEINVTDANVVDFEVTSTNVVIQPHVWTHVAIVQNGIRPTLYVNGETVPMTDTTATDLTSWFDQATLCDGAHIGAAEEGGAAALTLEFAGYIHKVKHWGATDSTGSLTASEVKDDFFGTPVQTGALVNSWDLEDDLLDDGTGADDGTKVGAILFSAGNNFSSRLTFRETVPLTADSLAIMADRGRGFAYEILAA